MRTIPVALGSFMLGALAMFFCGSHLSTPQSVYAQAPVRDKAAIPVIPPLHHAVMKGGLVTDMAYAVDGMEAKGTRFTNVTFEYGGGAYKLENATIVPPINVSLTGAAANTAAFLSAFGLLGCPTAEPPRPEGSINQAITKTSSVRRPIHGTFMSPYGQ